MFANICKHLKRRRHFVAQKHARTNILRVQMAYQKLFVLLRARLASHRGRHGENFARMFPNMSQDREQRTKLTEVRRAELPRWKFLKRCHCRVLLCHGVTSYRSSSLKRTMIARFLSYFQFSRCYLFLNFVTFISLYRVSPKKISSKKIHLKRTFIDQHYYLCAKNEIYLFSIDIADCQSFLQSIAI